MPSKGKREGAFSWGSFGTLPYIMMSFTGDITSVSTLAHELGHSMHSLLTWRSQPYVYSPYSTFIAEVASNVHQALVRASLLRPDATKDLKIAVIEEAMATLARFERETHRRVERGEALTADTMTDVMMELLQDSRTTMHSSTKPESPARRRLRKKSCVAMRGPLPAMSGFSRPAHRSTRLMPCGLQGSTLHAPNRWRKHSPS
jgi:oligoendopeptidase F